MRTIEGIADGHETIFAGGRSMAPPLLFVDLSGFHYEANVFELADVG